MVTCVPDRRGLGGAALGHFPWRALLGAALLGATACGSDGAPDGTPEAGAQAPNDASGDADTAPARDAGDASVSDAGSAPDAGADAGDAASGEYPAQLSQAGLYSDIASETLAPGVVAYRPRYELWSDGAEKRRWLFLPENATIDSSDPDFWHFPVGTKAFKEFVRDGVRVETRLVHKTGPGDADWVMVAYQWNAAQTDAFPVPDGVTDASGTAHDIPSQMDCVFCHEKLSGRLLGVGAIQLGHDDGDLTLRSLVESGRLSHPPDDVAPALPGDASAQAALGYLHANCGTCHNPTSSAFLRTDLDTWLRVEALSSVQATALYQTAVGVENDTMFSTSPLRIAPGSTTDSEIYRRMTLRTQRGMPPLGTELLDDAGLAAVSAFILGLDGASSGASGSGP